MTFKVGDRVAIVDHFNGTYAMRKIVEVKKRFLVDSRGGKWSLEGRYEYGRANSNFGSHIEHWTEDHAQELARKNIKLWISKVDWEKSPFD